MEDLKIMQFVFHSIVFVTGVIGNGILLIIFIRHREMRTSPNMVLFSLVIGDSLSLIINIPRLYSHECKPDMSSGHCIFYRFVSFLCFCVSVYSLVMLSAQRFFLLNNLPSSQGPVCRLLNKFSSVFYILSIWIISFIFAGLHAFYVMHDNLYDSVCYHESPATKGYCNPKNIPATKEYYNPKNIPAMDMLAILIIPLSLISIFTVMSSTEVQQDSENQHCAMSVKVILALFIIFAISYIPFYLSFLLIGWADLRPTQTEKNALFFVTFSLVFVHSSANPIALYISDSTFRSYFNSYFRFKSYKPVPVSIEVRDRTNTYV